MLYEEKPVEKRRYTVEEAKKLLDEVQNYADYYSTCAKVKVGSAIISDLGFDLFTYGCNHGIENCVKNGCRRMRLYGDNSKEHRLPSDCDALHSEVDAISKAAKGGVKTEGATIVVTRYPCEACARAIAAAGITTVIYGRKEPMSKYAEDIIRQNEGVEVYHIFDWMKEDNNA